MRLFSPLATRPRTHPISRSLPPAHLIRDRKFTGVTQTWYWTRASFTQPPTSSNPYVRIRWSVSWISNAKSAFDKHKTYCSGKENSLVEIWNWLLLIISGELTLAFPPSQYIPLTFNFIYRAVRGKILFASTRECKLHFSSVFSELDIHRKCLIISNILLFLLS